MRLSKLLRPLEAYRLVGSPLREVAGLSYDSRRLRPGELFFAWKGSHHDGHRFLEEALARGACGVVCEELPLLPLPEATFVQVPSSRAALSLMASAWYGHPSRDLDVAGITGTNGKTTTAYFLYTLLQRAGKPSGLLGTVEYRVGGVSLPASRTTPEGLELQELLARIRDAGAAHAVMEVSSHALAQGRADGVRFRLAIFTNLSPEHLDFHASLEEYFLEKCRLLRLLQKPRSSLVVPWDDPYGKRMAALAAGRVRLIRCGINVQGDVDLEAAGIRLSLEGTEFSVRWRGSRWEKVRLPCLGEFNVRNFLSALGGALALGVPWRKLLELWQDLPQVPGRMERFFSPRGFAVVVDYAHTEDGLRQVLQTLRSLRPRALSVVVGCGGNRDRSKRPKMVKVACELCDRVYFTADNPRDEPLEAIFADMRAGVPEGVKGKIYWIWDRREAIGAALADAVEGDIVCVAGKGHERTQEIGGKFFPLDDREIVSAFLRN